MTDKSITGDTTENIIRNATEKAVENVIGTTMINMPESITKGVTKNTIKNITKNITEDATVIEGNDEPHHKPHRRRSKPFFISAITAVLLIIQAFLPMPFAPVVSTAPTAFTSFAPTVPATVLAASSTESIDQRLDEQIDFLKLLIKAADDLYYEDMDTQDLIDGAYKGVFDRLDPYSVYYTDEEYEEFEVEVTGTFGGIGVQIALRDGFITVIAPLDGTPAYRAGIKTGDRLITVDDLDVRELSLDKVANMLRGESGTIVKLGILREGQASIIEFELVRGIIEVNPVVYEVLEDDIGYIRLNEFNEHAIEHVDEALEYFDELEIKDIILDLRNNPGGIIDQSVEVARRFVPVGPIVHIERRNVERQTLNSRLRAQKYNLAVLVNGGSASAAEIVAGAVQDTKAGTLIGTKTFGKGTVQQVWNLANGGRLKLTIARYLTPEGRSIDGEGIIPDIVVENLNPEEEYKDALAPIKGDRKPCLGTIGLDVLGAEQRLHVLGYDIGDVDGVFDTVLEQAVKTFQSDASLYPYGVLDLVTQERLLTEYELYIEENTPDVQLQKAIEVLKTQRN